MYTGTNQTAINSQKNIADALIRMLRTTPYQKITVSAICKEAEVSRQTFYSLFESKDNVVVYLLDKKHSYKPDEECTCHELSLDLMSRTYSQYIIDRTEFLSLLVANDLTYLLHDNLYESLFSCDCFMPDSDAVTREFTAEFTASGLSGIIRTYIRCEKRLDQNQLADMIYHLFAGDYLESRH